MAEENISQTDEPVEETGPQAIVQEQETPVQTPAAPPATQTAPQPTAVKTNGPKKSLVKKVLVALALILIAAGLITAGMRFYKSWQLKKRDTQRKADIQTLQKALETFRGKTQDQKYYPGDATEFTMVKTGVMEKLPKDPKNVPPYAYIYSGRPAGCTATCTGYILFACLENANDQDGKAPIGTCQTKIYEVTK